MANLNDYISNADSKVKLHEIREAVRKADAAELSEVVKLAEREIFELKLKGAVQPLENPMRIRHVRKLIARVKTEQTARAAKAA